MRLAILLLLVFLPLSYAIADLQRDEIVEKEDVRALFPLYQQYNTQMSEALFLERFELAKAAGLHLYKFSLKETGEIVGMVGLRNSADIYSGASKYMDSLVVSNAHRRKGYGSEIMQQVGAMAKAEGSECVWWTATSHNEAAGKFYLNAIEAHQDNGVIYWATAESLADLVN